MESKGVGILLLLLFREVKNFRFILNDCPSHGRIGKEVALHM